MKKLLFLLSFFSTFLGIAQGPEVTPQTRMGNQFNGPGRLLQLNSQGKVDESLLPASVGTGTTTGDVITWSAAALGIAKNGTDQSARLQSVANMPGVRKIWFNDPSTANYVINGSVTFPSNVTLQFEPGNKLVSTPTVGSGVMSVTEGLSGWGSFTVNGSGTNFLTETKPGTQLLVQGVVGINSTGGQGLNYSPGTYFTVTGNGQGAVLKAVLGPQGQVYGAVPITVGYGYTNATITITDPAGTGSGFGGATAVLGKVPFGTVKSVESNTSLTLRVPSRIKFVNLAVQMYAGVINGATIQAGDDQQITDGSVSLLGYNSSSSTTSARWYGAIGDNTTDNAYPFQRWIDDIIYGQAKVGRAIIPSGRYISSKSILGMVFITDPNQSVVNFSLTLTGGGNSIEFGNNTTVIFTDSSGFGFGFTRVKGLTLENMRLEGVNHFDLSLADVLTKDDATFAAPNIRTHPQSPQSLATIDPIGGNKIPNNSRYPGFEHLYQEPENVGSTDIIIRNMELRYAYLCLNVSPSGTQQNAESISTYDLRGGDCYAFASTGNTQTRQYNMYNTRIWNRTKFAVDGATFGSGGTLPHVFGMNLSGTRWIVNGSTRVNTFDGNNITMEICGGIGGTVTSTTNGTGNLTINLNNCDLRRAGANPPDANNFRKPATPGVYTGTYTPAFQFQARCLKLNLTNCEAIDNEHYGVPFNAITNTTTIINGYHSNFGMLSMAQASFSNVDFGTGISWSSSGTYVSENIDNPTRLMLRSSAIVNGEKFSTGTNFRKAGYATSVTAINKFESTWSFTIPPSDAARLVGGDRVTMYAPTMVNEFKQTGTMFVEAGPIYSIDYATGVVTLQNPFNGLVPGMVFDAYIDQPMWVNNMHVGNASGTTITGVIKEGSSPAISLIPGDMVVHPSYPSGYAIIKTISGSTITVDRSITSPRLIGFSSYGYQKRCSRTSPTERVGEGFKTGDEIINSDKINNPNVDKWIIKTPGVTYSSIPPTWGTVNITAN